MLVCPQCQFENPDDHKFCQRCGESLTELECPGCGTMVPFDKEACPVCHTTTGLTLRALLTVLPSQLLPADAAPKLDTLATLLSYGKFLDPYQRYQLLEPLPKLNTDTPIVARVLDCQPLQPSRLETSADQTAIEPAIEPLSPEQWLETVPLAARPYLTLPEQYSASLPKLHDAWEEAGLSVVLLEERTDLPSLLDLWGNPEVLPLQMLHWLHDMVRLWVVLQPYGACQSLLELDNLRIDEDYLLCLQQLYVDLQSPQLPMLGQAWQQLFHQSQRTQRSDLAQLCVDLSNGDIETSAQLQLRLEAIAATLQLDFSIAMNPASQPDVRSEDSALPIAASVPIEPPRAAPTPLSPEVASEMPMLLPLSEPATDTSTFTPDLNPIEFEEEAASESDDLPTVVLPMRLVSLEDAGRTDIGRQRDHNEDCFSVETEVRKLETPQGRSLQAKGLYILCDGMGGHAGGEVASALAVETLLKYFEQHWTDRLPSEDAIRDGIQLANRTLFEMNQENARSGSGRMGTTLVLVLMHDTDVAIAHVGDSRLYRFSRRRGLEQLTVDHEVGQREIQRGVEPAIAYARPDAYQLTQALGPRDENFINPEIKFLQLNEDMLLLLCSDGLTDNDLLELHWRTHVEPLLNLQTNLDQGVNQLIELANQNNGHDNITAIAIRARVRPNLDLLSRRS